MMARLSSEALHQLQSPNHWPMPIIVGPEFENMQQIRNHVPIVSSVGVGSQFAMWCGRLVLWHIEMCFVLLGPIRAEQLIARSGKPAWQEIFLAI